MMVKFQCLNREKEIFCLLYQKEENVPRQDKITSSGLTFQSISCHNNVLKIARSLQSLALSS